MVDGDGTVSRLIDQVHRLAAPLGFGRPETSGCPALPRLDDAHPRAGSATRRSRGIAAVPVADIMGTASYPRGARCRDFLPRPGHEPADWAGRWQRLETAAHDLTPLPPVELLKTQDGYWVVDGHNRVALARATGQAWIDADVTELLPAPHGALAPAHRTARAHGGID